jgi:hypothetical protein
VKVLLGHNIPPFGLRGGETTHEHREQHVGIVPQKEPYFPPPDRRMEHREMKVEINYRPRSDKYVHLAQGHHFCTRALLKPGMKEVVSQIEVGLNPHIGLTQGYKGRHVKHP